ncbi:hypothetical protein PF003_g21283 [Phytophthora fragariae]|nr:hypothetical protein PF003_g21283 [Phytophthora fragariae]
MLDFEQSFTAAARDSGSEHFDGRMSAETKGA